jgi:DNA-binding CsgD family transcriptional regulator
MEINDKNTGKNGRSKSRFTKTRKVISIPYNKNGNGLKQTIVLDIPPSMNQDTEQPRYRIEITVTEDTTMNEPEIECPVKEIDPKENESSQKPAEAEIDYLTPREIEIMELLIKCWPNKWIANYLGIKENTVRVHIQNIFPKLGAANRAEAILKYQKDPEKYKKQSSCA